MNIQHSSRQDTWGTPKWIIDKVKEVLGYIDLDPASDSAANRIVGAKRFITKEEDGLSQEWAGKVFLNPPGGKRGKESITKLFWDKLSRSFEDGKVEEAIFMCFSIEALQSTQSCVYPILNYTFCVPAKRIAFTNYLGEEKHAPSHSNAIVYLGDREALFEKVFREVGRIK